MEKRIVVQADDHGVWLGPDYHDLDHEEAAAYQAALARFPEEIPGQGRILSLAQLAQVRAEVGRLLESAPKFGSLAWFEAVPEIVY
jgi:hypothetical protein